MSEQQDNQKPHIPFYMLTGTEAYRRIKELTSQLEANPDDPAAKNEFDRLTKFIGTNPELAAEFKRLRTADAEKAAEFAQVSQTPSTQPAKPEKKYVLEASYDLGATIEKVAKGIKTHTTESGKKTIPTKQQSVMQPRSENIGRSLISAANLTGEVVDFWSDLIEGKASQHNDFVEAYHKIVSDRQIVGIAPTSHTVYIGDIITRKQYFELFKWYTTKAALRTETLGNDLYVSWRVFVKEQISWLRIILWLIGCLLAAIFLTVGFNLQIYTQYNQYYGSSTNPYLQSTLDIFIKIAIGSGIYLIILGLFRRNGDWLGMFRRPLDEFDRDDAMIAGHIVHKSVLQAADAIGIDTMKLAPKELVPSDRRRASRRI